MEAAIPPLTSWVGECALLHTTLQGRPQGWEVHTPATGGTGGGWVQAMSINGSVDNDGMGVRGDSLFLANAHMRAAVSCSCPPPMPLPPSSAHLLPPGCSCALPARANFCPASLPILLSALSLVVWLSTTSHARTYRIRRALSACSSPAIFLCRAILRLSLRYLCHSVPFKLPHADMACYLHSSRDVTYACAGLSVRRPPHLVLCRTSATRAPD